MEGRQSNTLGVIGKDPVNFVGSDHGRRQAVATQVEQKATLKGKDVSAQARRRPAANLAAGDAMKRCSISRPPRRRCSPRPASSTTIRPIRQPLWVVQTRFYWKQHFAARQTLAIVHGYTPISGGLQYSQGGAEGPDKDLAKRYCIDPASPG